MKCPVVRFEMSMVCCLDNQYIEAPGSVPVFLENLHGMSSSGTYWPLVVLCFNVGMEVFDDFFFFNKFIYFNCRLNTLHG